MAAEVHALIHTVDDGMIVQDTMNELLNRGIGREAFVDSRTLFKVVRKISSNAEKCLQVDIFALGELQKEELKRIGWTGGKQTLRLY